MARSPERKVIRSHLEQMEGGSQEKSPETHCRRGGEVLQEGSHRMGAGALKGSSLPREEEGKRDSGFAVLSKERKRRPPFPA